MLEVRLHGGLWKKASTVRREEWTRALDELNDANQIVPVDENNVDDGAIELVQPPSGIYEVRLFQGAFDQLGEVALNTQQMKPLFDEYERAILELAQLRGSSATRGFETLDYAKKVVHDDAAEYLQQSLTKLVSMTLPDARRLFTLLFLIHSKLPEESVRYHKFHF